MNFQRFQQSSLNFSEQKEIVPIDSSVRLKPINYPGNFAPWHCVVNKDNFQRIIYTPGRRLGQSRVLVLDEQDSQKTKTVSLNKYLLLANSARIDERFPVVGVGSNSDPQVMAEKFARFSDEHGIYIDPVFPMFRAQLFNVGIGHLPVASKGGYFALAAHSIDCEEGLYSTVTVSFLDRSQMRALDETEPNYIRSLISSNTQSKIDLKIEDVSDGGKVEKVGNELLDAFYVYRSRWGILRDEITCSPLPKYDSQKELFSRLGGRFPELYARLEKFSLGGQTQSSNLSLEEYPHLNSVISNSDGLESFLISSKKTSEGSSDTQLERDYSDITSRWVGLKTSKYRVAATIPGVHETRNAPLAVVTEQMLKEIKERHHTKGKKISGNTVKVSFKAPQLEVANHKFDCVAQLVSIQGASDVVELDQLVRNAIGVELNEFVDLDFLDHNFTKFNRFQVFRRQTADTSIVEQDSCIMDSTAMKLLGVEDGDQIVLLGQPKSNTDSRIPHMKIRVFAAEDKIELRRGKSGGGLSSRFPGTDATLGVHPDIPWIFLDGDAAKKLNVSKMQPVLARASYASLWAREVREISIALSLAFIGIFSALVDEENRNTEAMIILASSVALILISASFLVGWKIITKVGLSFSSLRRRRK